MKTSENANPAAVSVDTSQQLDSERWSEDVSDASTSLASEIHPIQKISARRPRVNFDIRLTHDQRVAAILMIARTVTS